MEKPGKDGVNAEVADAKALMTALLEQNCILRAGLELSRDALRELETKVAVGDTANIRDEVEAYVQERKRITLEQCAQELMRTGSLARDGIQTAIMRIAALEGTLQGDQVQLPRRAHEQAALQQDDSLAATTLAQVPRWLR